MEVTNVIKRNVSIAGLEPKNTLSRILMQVKIKLHAAILHIRAELGCDDNETLRNNATCQTLLHSRVAEVRRSLPNTTFLTISFDADIAVIGPRQTKKAGPNLVPEDRAETGGIQDL